MENLSCMGNILLGLSYLTRENTEECIFSSPRSPFLSPNDPIITYLYQPHHLLQMLKVRKYFLSANPPPPPSYSPWAERADNSTGSKQKGFVTFRIPLLFAVVLTLLNWASSLFLFVVIVVVVFL